MVRVKICGITNIDDARKAVNLGAWAIGFNFYKKSPRYIGGYKARKIIAQLPPFVTPVGIFVNSKEGAVRDIAEFCGIQTLQFHGDETPAYCQRFKGYKVIKAFRVDERFDWSVLKNYPVDAFLLDARSDESYGGTGKTFDWALVRNAKSFNKPLILSGGLNPANIRAAVEEVRPYGVDVCSGVEIKPGIKDERALAEFFTQVTILQ